MNSNNMKKAALKVLVFSILILIHENCFAQFTRFDEDKLTTSFDEFKNAKSVLLQINCHSVESEDAIFFKQPNYNLNANFYKTQPSDSDITISFSLIIRGIYEPLDSVVYLNLNDSISKLRVHNITKNIISDIDASTTGIGNEKRVTDIRTVNKIIYNGKIYLPNYLCSKIKPTSKFILRMYFDYLTATFSFLPSETTLLYQFIQAEE